MPNLPVRDRADAKIAGVCSALARLWAIDPVIVRVAFVVLGLLTNGFIVAAYFALWGLMPDRNGEAPLHRLFPATRRWSWTTLVTVVVVVAATVGALASGSGPGAFVVLALAWIILRFGFAGRRSGMAGTPTPPPPAPTTPFERSAQAWRQRLDNLEAGRPADWVPETDAHPDPAGLYGPTSPWDPPSLVHVRPVARRRGMRSWLGILVALGTTWTALAAASALGVVVSPLAWMSATLLVLGVALLVTSRPTRAVWGRPVLLLPVTIFVALTTLVQLVPSQVHGPADALAPVIGAIGGPGEVTHLPIGDNTIDLSARPVSTETLQYRQLLGDLVLVVPTEGNVVVRGHTSLGDLRTPDTDQDGFDIEREWRRIVDPEAPTITIEVSLGLGELEVRT